MPIRNKFNDLQELIKGNIDVVMIAETKIGASFITAQYLLNNYHQPFRLDVIANVEALIKDGKRLGYFLNSNNLVNLVKTNTCFKGNGSCIDLINEQEILL